MDPTQTGAIFHRLPLKLNLLLCDFFYFAWEVQKLTLTPKGHLGKQHRSYLDSHLQLVTTITPTTARHLPARTPHRHSYILGNIGTSPIKLHRHPWILAFRA
jgi:hypothetical protein